MNPFAELIRAAREKLGLTHQDVASYVGLGRRATAMAWEQGAFPDPRKIIRLCEVLEISYEDMLIALGASEGCEPARDEDKEEAEAEAESDEAAPGALPDEPEDADDSDTPEELEETDDSGS